MISDGCSCGRAWNRTPSQPRPLPGFPWLRVATVLAKAKNRLASPRAGPEQVQQLGELVVEHGLQPLPADVPFRGAVEGVADRHVVGRNGLGHCPGRAADREEPPGDLLAAADLGERAVRRGVEVDRQGFLPCGRR